ncbi:hypothetical protein EAF00_002660 [Botryotinia globosa]|nr:hypothetical protein EAF00_002660 [Botryotinia globosa]
MSLSFYPLKFVTSQEVSYKSNLQKFAVGATAMHCNDCRDVVGSMSWLWLPSSINYVTCSLLRFVAFQSPKTMTKGDSDNSEQI